MYIYIWPASSPPVGPHGGLRPFHQKLTCLTHLSSGPRVVQIWSRHPPNLEGTNLSESTVWVGLKVLGVRVSAEKAGAARVQARNGTLRMVAMSSSASGWVSPSSK